MTYANLNCLTKELSYAKLKLFVIKLFDNSTLCKQMTDILIELLVMHNNTWNHLTEQMNE